MKRGIASLLLALGIVSFAICQTPPTDPILEKEKEKHQGTWKAMVYRIEDKETPAAIAQSITRTVAGDRVVWKREGKSFAATRLEIDPKQSPPWIDVIPEGGPWKGKKVHGIYRWKDEKLELCMAPPGKPRPSEWDSPAGSGISIMIFEKVPDGEKSPKK